MSLFNVEKFVSACSVSTRERNCETTDCLSKRSRGDDVSFSDVPWHFTILREQPRGKHFEGSIKPKWKDQVKSRNTAAERKRFLFKKQLSIFKKLSSLILLVVRTAQALKTCQVKERGQRFRTRNIRNEAREEINVAEPTNNPPKKLVQINEKQQGNKKERKKEQEERRVKRDNVPRTILRKKRSSGVKVYGLGRGVSWWLAWRSEVG